MFSRSARFYDAVYSFKDYASEAAALHPMIQERSPGARALLDVACGTGKHLEHLRARYEVAGLDVDSQLLEIARARLPDVAFHEADMLDFDLDRRFDVVTCLFSSIGYVGTREKLGRAVAAMAAHLEPGGILVVEPWITPEAWEEGHVGAVFVDEPELKIARVDVAEVENGLSVIEFHYLVGTPDGIERFEERHELGLFTHEDYVNAFEAAGLEVEHDSDGLIGRGLYLGRMK